VHFGFLSGEDMDGEPLLAFFFSVIGISGRRVLKMKLKMRFRRKSPGDVAAEEESRDEDNERGIDHSLYVFIPSPSIPRPGSLLEFDFDFAEEVF